MIETVFGPMPSDSPFQNRNWAWGADGIVAFRSRLDDTVIVMSEQGSKVEMDMVEENRQVAPL